MADDEDLLSRANSLINPDSGATRGERRQVPRQMRRRRSFLASTTSAEDAEGSTRLARRNSEDDDLPLLTDVVVDVEAEPETSIDDIAADLRPTLAAELAQLIDRHLAASLPALIEAAVADAAEHLRGGIEASITMAAADFVAQRGQLPLPLDKPASSEASASDLLE
jgi:hypothetical protein